MEMDSVEIIKKGKNYQIRIGKEEKIFSYIISADKIDKLWIDNIFSMTLSIINNNNNNSSSSNNKK